MTINAGQLEAQGFKIESVCVSWAGSIVHESIMKKGNECFLFAGEGRWQKYLICDSWLSPVYFFT